MAEDEKPAKPPLWKYVLKHLLLGLMWCAIILVIPAMIAIPGMMNPERSSFEHSAKVALRNISDAEAAFRETDSQGRYGSWDDLMDAGYISADKSPDKFVKNYSIQLSATSNIEVPTTDDGTALPPFSTFTIVAFPRITKPPGYLSTFAIREDHILRVFPTEIPGVHAWGQDGDYGARTWEPLHIVGNLEYF